VPQSSVICINSQKDVGTRARQHPVRPSVCAGSLEESISSSLQLPVSTDPHFAAAIGHVLNHPGSLVRPRLVLQIGHAFGLDRVAGQNLATALEYFHTASLIFDDLPCMDDAEERRGAPCVHRAHGEHQAILSALALINRAYVLLLKTIATSSLDTRLEAIDYVDQCLGVEGLLNGQSLDLSYAKLPHTPETTQRIAKGKTVSLIRLTLVLPAILGNASQREIQLLERISLFWGLAYQMVDDLKDILQSAEQTGKTGARDALLDRPNIAMVLGVPETQKRLQRMIAIGDHTLKSALRNRPSLGFLEKMRDTLQGELDLVVGSPRARKMEGAL